MSENQVYSLFNSCISVILGSPELMSKSSRCLPKRIAQYILFGACMAKDYRAVEVIVRHWSHPELSFDFMKNTLCRHKKELSRCCIEAHNYFNVHSTSYCADCVPSISLGLFNNLQTCLKNNRYPSIRVVDLSKIRVMESSKGNGSKYSILHFSPTVKVPKC